MYSLYIFSIIVGGFFVITSALLGGDSDIDVDADVDIDIDVDVDVDIDADADADVDIDPGLDLSFLMPFISFKFWTFALFSFGMTGIALTYLKKGNIAVFIISLLMGLGIGLSVYHITKRIQQTSKESEVNQKHYIGQIGTVTLPFNNNEKGKVEIYVKNKNVNMIAISEDENFSMGEKCVVLEIKDNYCVVSKLEDENLI